MPKIENLTSIQVLDSRGLPTISTEILLDDGTRSIAMVPSGASTGEKEALELRDGGDAFHGKGVKKAIDNVNDRIKNSLIGENPIDQENIDQILNNLDGTNDKSNLGANAILSVSIASAKATSKSENLDLHNYFNILLEKKMGKTIDQVIPIPMLNILNGGEHADNNIDIQEFMVIPKGAVNFSQAMQWSSEIYWNLKFILNEKGLSTAVGDEGGFAPNLNSNREALELIAKAVDKTNLELGSDIFISLDCAASEFYENGIYHLKGEDRELATNEFVEYLEGLANDFPIISIEDGMDENDLEGWKLLTQQIGSKCQLVGDDLFVTNPDVLKKGINEEIANSVLIKYNQIGTISETLETISIASNNDYKNIISHRSGETEDSSISDLAVGTGAGQIKTGAPCRSERVAKYNRLYWIDKKNNFSFG
ncbi:MAG: phosphopyruvate hydratase [Gammaproteobacteria bacterium]